MIRVMFAILFFLSSSAHAEQGMYQNTQLAESVSHAAADQVEKVLRDNGMAEHSMRGYAILIGTMVGSAVLTTYLSSRLPPHMQFASVFIAQLSTLGVFVLGAPIWEPMSSKFRKWAFGMSQDNAIGGIASPELEAAWIRTQRNYSLNAQMSRNVISQFVLAVRANFQQAYESYRANNPVYSADQVAEAAYRMRILFKDISPTDPSVAAAVVTSFTNHVQLNEDFVRLVWSRLKEVDAEASQPEVHRYYEIIMATWLRQKTPVGSSS